MSQTKISVYLGVSLGKCEIVGKSGWPCVFVMKPQASAFETDISQTNTQTRRKF